MKSYKSTESFCLSIIFTQMIGPLFDTFSGAMFTFSSARFRNMCKPRTGWSTSIGILWKWTSELIELAGDCECRLAWLPPIRNFLANEIYHFSREFEKWLAISASVGGVGGVLAWVTWMTCLRW